MIEAYWSPTMPPPKSCVLSPASVAAFTIPTESGG